MTQDEVLARWRAAGGRITTSRRAIVDVLVELGPEHATAMEIAERIHVDHPEIHASTVYRTLDTLTELGVIEHIHLGHAAAAYHFVDRPHHHLVCESCAVVVDVPIEPFVALADQLRSEHAFEVDPKHFALVGLCGECASRAHTRPRR